MKKKILAILVIIILLLPVWVLAQTLYEYYNTGDDNINKVYGSTWRGQTFTSSEFHKITSIKLLSSRIGSGKNLIVSIRENLTGGDLCSGSKSTWDFPGGATWNEILLNNCPILEGNTQYGIIVRIPTGDTNNTIYWNFDSSSPTYENGKRLLSNDSGESWTHDTYSDHMFEVWGEPPEYSLILILPAHLVSTINYIDELFTDLGLFIWLIIGIPLGFYVIEKVIILLPK